MTFEYSPDATPVNIGENGQKVSTKQAHEDQVRAINRNQDAAIVTQGAKAGLLQTHTSDPTGAFQLAANLFSASVQIPFTVLFGQQTGRLASDEDKADMLARCKSRQESDLTPMVEEFIVRMQAAGIIEAGEFDHVASLRFRHWLRQCFSMAGTFGSSSPLPDPFPGVPGRGS